MEISGVGMPLRQAERLDVTSRLCAFYQVDRALDSEHWIRKVDTEISLLVAALSLLFILLAFNDFYFILSLNSPKSQFQPKMLSLLVVVTFLLRVVCAVPLVPLSARSDCVLGGKEIHFEAMGEC
jgi:hypothetical protein